MPGLQSYANSLLRDIHLSEEAVEDVWLKIWANRKTLHTIQNFSYYLYTATKHTALNYLKRRSRQDIILEEEQLEQVNVQTPEFITVQKENVKQIEAAINALPLRSRQIFRLVKEEDLKYKEVAELLSISIKTVEAHMTLAYSRIIESIEEILPEMASHPALKKRSGN